MIRNFKSILSLLVLIIFFPSCIKYYKLSKKEFPQGEEKNDYRKVKQANLRSSKIYDQFETKAIFDVLWMSDDTKMAYADIHSKKSGKDESTHDALLRRKLEESKHWISFYLLADIRDKAHISLSDKNSSWSLHLDIDKQKVTPISIKEIDISPEIQFLFGSHFSTFKTAYLVRFPATRLSGTFYLKEDSKMNLIISSTYKCTKLLWDIGEKYIDEKVYADDDFYWV